MIGPTFIYLKSIQLNKNQSCNMEIKAKSKSLLDRIFSISSHFEWAEIWLKEPLFVQCRFDFRLLFTSILARTDKCAKDCGIILFVWHVLQCTASPAMAHPWHLLFPLTPENGSFVSKRATFFKEHIGICGLLAYCLLRLFYCNDVFCESKYCTFFLSNSSSIHSLYEWVR